jgi:hypothetical protein
MERDTPLPSDAERTADQLLVDRLGEVEALFHGALEVPVHRREAWLSEAAGDRELSMLVGELVAHHRR